MFSISANITGYFLRQLPQHLLTLGLVLGIAGSSAARVQYVRILENPGSP